jgi:hypothetical protein
MGVELAERQIYGVARPLPGLCGKLSVLDLNQDIDADYFAFCDQDDIWEPHRLSAGLRHMDARGSDRPQMFCSRTLTIGADGTVLGASPLFINRRHSATRWSKHCRRQYNGFQPDRPRSVDEGVETGEFRQPRLVDIYDLTGTGGLVHYAGEPLVRYRQHAHNAVGQNRTLAAQIDRFRRLFSGAFFDWTTANLHGLAVNRDMLSPEALEALQLFSNARKGNIVQRVKRLRASGVHRQKPVAYFRDRHCRDAGTTLSCSGPGS